MRAIKLRQERPAIRPLLSELEIAIRWRFLQTGHAYGVVIRKFACSAEPLGSANSHTEPEGSALHAARLPRDHHLRRLSDTTPGEAAPIQPIRQTLPIKGGCVQAGALHLAHKRRSHHAPKSYQPAEHSHSRGPRTHTSPPQHCIKLSKEPQR
jgi:hypothetical protein